MPTSTTLKYTNDHFLLNSMVK